MKILMARQAILFGFALAATAHATNAAGKFPVPDGCTAYVTVQHSNCNVSQHYTCSKDAKGDQWAVYEGVDGPYYMSRIDAQTRWMESVDLISGDVDQLDRETDPASVTTLLSTGRDDYDFTTLSDKGEVRRYVGYDKLTGETVNIDGITLARTVFDMSAYDESGAFLHRRKGRQFVSSKWRIFFSDQEDFENAYGDKQSTNDTPMTFAQPGEPGFLESMPQFGCDMMMTDANTQTKGPHS
jgi:hypothetical protein